MREVKFRAWDKEDNIMLESGFTELMDEYITSTGKVLEKQVDIGICYSDVYLVDISNKRILMQYTGLKDKNGKEIYEGDIVHVKYSHDYMTFEGYERGYSQLKNGYVKFNHGAFDVYHTDKEGREVCAGIVIQEHLTDIETEWEIIGNIYENPELLETK